VASAGNWLSVGSTGSQWPRFFDDHEPLPREAAAIVDEVVVHDPAKPGAGLLDVGEVIDTLKSLRQHILEQILGIGSRVT
jgi:hypothetical protein